MNLFKNGVFAIIVLAIVTVSCKKKDDDDTTTPAAPSEYYSFDVDGVNYTYSAKLSPIAGSASYLDTSQNTLVLTLYKSLVDPDFATMIIVGIDVDNVTLPFVMQNDTNILSHYPTFHWEQLSGESYQSSLDPGLNPAPKLKVTLTGKANDIAEGTFEGLIYNFDETDYIEVKNGKFKVAFVRM